MESAYQLRILNSDCLSHKIWIQHIEIAFQKSLQWICNRPIEINLLHQAWTMNGFSISFWILLSLYGLSLWLMDVVIHDMYESTRFVLEKTNTFRFIKVVDGEQVRLYPQICIHPHVPQIGSTGWNDVELVKGCPIMFCCPGRPKSLINISKLLCKDAGWYVC